MSAQAHVLAVRTNLAPIMSSACGYYFLAGVQIFGSEVAATAAVVLFIPALVIHSAVTALPHVVLAAAALSAQYPPHRRRPAGHHATVAAGRAEGVRAFCAPRPSRSRRCR